jgi:hypothetical protein
MGQSGFPPGRPFGFGPRRPSTPTTWVGLILMALVILIAVIVFASIANSGPGVDPSGPCVGGPAMGEAGQPVGNGNYRFSCVDGGSTVVHLGN